MTWKTEVKKQRKILETLHTFRSFSVTFLFYKQTNNGMSLCQGES